MCGFAGVWLDRRENIDDIAALARQMAAAVAHRGPDADGVWADAQAGLALGHRRLSIIDLSIAGAQPMTSASGRWVIAFNGEIYNFETLRRTLAAYGRRDHWRGRSDTEVLVEMFDAFGVEKTVRQCDGMFALAAWDRQDQVLYLARDPFGEKPLYYGLGAAGLYFGSEVSAVAAGMGRDQLSLDPTAIQCLLAQGQIPAPLSVFRGVRKLEAGAIVRWTASALRERTFPPVGRYWSPIEAASRAGYTAPPGSENDAVEQLRALLETTIRSRLISDVPLGAMLSGGVDSALIATLAQRASDKPIKTFTIGFENQSFDETAAAEKAAGLIGSDHLSMRVTDKDAIEVAPKLCEIYSEPFADSSQIPTYLVSRCLHRQVTVALSGDGGDELFGGYVRHREAPRLWGMLRLLPYSFRRGLGRLRDAVGVQRLGRWMRAGDGLGEDANRTIKGLGLIDAASADDVYRRLVNHRDAGLDVIGSIPKRIDMGRRFMLADTIGYLDNDILTKVDRASMAVSLETRAPFLSRAVFDFAWSLPSPWLSGGGQTKRILRKLGHSLAPELDWNGPKRGFSVPLDDWLRGPLRDWASTLIDEMPDDGHIDVARQRRLWDAHDGSRGNHATELWPALMLQSWRRRHGF
jgi:asparagine synthase (glutamine-hydrolysing)